MSELFLGRMEYANGDWARIEPLAMLHEGGQWAPLPNRLREFPEEGLVFAPPSVGLGNAKYGSLWVFRREANARATSGKDRYIVSDTAPATPVLDLTSCSLEEARVKLFEQGIEFPRNCGDKAVVALAGGLFCILDFEPEGNGVRHARPAVNPVQLMRLPPTWMTSGTINGRRVLPLMYLPHLPTIRRVNWYGDAEFVERILLRARKHFAQFGPPDGLPGKETLQRIARALETQQLLPSGDDDVELDLERLRAQWPRLLARFQAAEDMRTFVLESNVAIDLRMS